MKPKHYLLLGLGVALGVSIFVRMSPDLYRYIKMSAM